MNLTYVILRLVEWAKYKQRDMDGGIGFKSKCAFVDVLPPGGAQDYAPDINESCKEIDQCMMALKKHNQEMHAAMCLHYLRGDLKRDDKLKRLGFGKSKYYALIDQSEQLILGWLNDMAVGEE